MSEWLPAPRTQPDGARSSGGGARACRSLRRWSGAEPPSLETLRRTYGNFDGMLVEAAHIEGKGLGVVAREEIPEGVAYYLCKLQRNHFGDCTYCIAGEGGVRSPVLPPSSRPSRQNPEPTLPTGYPLMDIFEGSFPPAGADGIPYIAPFANEPDQANENCRLVEAPLPAPDRLLGRGRRACRYSAAVWPCFGTVGAAKASVDLQRNKSRQC